MKVGMLTAGGLAPCLSSAVGGLIERYSEIAPEVDIVGYMGGFRGLLTGEALAVTAQVRARAGVLHRHGGSPLGNSRVKLTNAADLVKRGLVKPGEDPLDVAMDRLMRDGVTILHTIGGDDTNSTAADLVNRARQNGHALTVVGLPKTVDNDIVPIRQSLGAGTAAEEGAIFFENVVNEQSANPRMLIVHEIMGRHCGWLTAATAHAYRARLAALPFLPELNLDRAHKDIDAVYIPEMAIDFASEAKRLKAVMDRKGCVSMFVSEGANAGEIVKEMESRGATVGRDAFGHIRLDSVKVGDWFADHFGRLIGAEKTLVQKSGYFARSAAANAADLRLIQGMVDLAVDCGLRGQSGVIGHDEERGGVLRAIEFSRIKGGKPFNVEVAWFDEMLRSIEQPRSAKKG